MKKTLRIVSSLAGSIFLVFVCLMAFVVLSSRIAGGEPTVLGYQVKVVLSGSMEPTFQTGSIISIKLRNNHSSYQKGDVITFRKEKELITHRILEIQKKNGNVLYKTKGDHNNAPDLWVVSTGEVVGKYTGFTIPYIGYAMDFTKSKEAGALLLIVPGILLVISAMRSIIGAKKDLEVLNKIG
ncbi:signal peptidase I SipW [Bacillus sp. AFS017336]|uniref:signal peptidase I SipW n=1 Tax=Bacillus sp. AFS017336 TaxID=2033489 RepID=UPI0027B962DC|nr:signal peptidase I [Bacillus sp. AFS017336]